MKLLWNRKGVRNEEKRGRKMARSDDALRTARAAESTRRLGSSWLCLSAQPQPTSANHPQPREPGMRLYPIGTAGSG